jgi:hypothetical protein
MSSHVTVVLANGERIEFEIADKEVAALEHRAAHDWLGREYEAAGCVPTNPMGKLLLADKVLSLARSRPERAFTEPDAWTQAFLRAALRAIERPVLTIDLGNNSLGY